MRYLYLVLWIALTANMLSAQLPATDLYVLKIFNNGERVSIKSPIYLSDFNPSGYNNQPAFVTPKKVYVTTNMYNETYTDLIELDLLDETYTRLTQTDSISEYSPDPAAPDDHYSTVRVEKDGTTQSLHLYPIDHSSSGTRVVKALDNVGYHEWLSEKEVALFLVDTPNKLVVSDLTGEQTTLICNNPGRTFENYRREQLYYVDKLRPDVWYIKLYDIATGDITTVVQTLPSSEDFAILPDGTLLMASGSSIYFMHPDRSTEWTESIDLYQYGIEDITRLAVSRNNLIIVNRK